MPALSPYSWAIIGTALIWAVLLIFLKRPRKRIILTSLIISPLALIDRTTIPGYWQPHPLYLSADLSAVIFTFFLSGIAAEIFYLVTHKSQVALKHKTEEKMAGICGVLLIISAAITFFLNLNGMYFVVASLVIVFCLTLIFLRKNLHQILLTGLLFWIFYLFSFTLWQKFSPASQTWWNQADLLGKVYFGNIPLGESIFSFLFGTAIASFQFLIPGFRK